MEDPLHMVLEFPLRSRSSRGASHAHEYEPPVRHKAPRGFVGPQDQVVILLQEEIRLIRDRVSVLEIALGLGPGGQVSTQTGKPGALEVLRGDLAALSQANKYLHDRVDHHARVADLLDLHRDVDYLRGEV
ncbi:hypothetical protein PI124_g6452 [Phytophthora idaei]|nr:hypothetical protein PI125_g6109 [Phytophthora idaei]KAG3162654.1 hypothetical protein PI126_g5889 [Phytophthora idaei]KAG3248860.1 hypothetical protein PI124_g6452 [Phytophthora idaei]